MRRLRLLVLCPALVLATLAAAAEAVFPPGARVGLVPPPGMQLSKRFSGFENQRGSAITIFEMPPEAAPQVLGGLAPEALKGQNITLRSREDTKVGDADAVLISGDQAIGGVTMRKWVMVAADPTVTAFLIAQDPQGAEGYGDDAMRAALKTVAVRAPLAMEDQIAALPFRLGDRAGFKPVRTGGGSLLMSERGEDGGVGSGQAVVIVAGATEPGPGPEQRDAFAMAMLRANTALRELVFERAQGFRQKGAEWHEIVARAKDAVSGAPVVVMQTIRWDRDGFVRVLGIAPEAGRDDLLPRFRSLADSVAPG
jgi:hypothetical protein